MFRHGTLRILAWSSHEMNTHPTQWCFGVSTRGPFPHSTSLSSCWRRATPSTGTVRRHVPLSCTSWTSTSNVPISVFAHSWAGNHSREKNDITWRRRMHFTLVEKSLGCVAEVWLCKLIIQIGLVFLIISFPLLSGVVYRKATLQWELFCFVFVIWGSWD